MFIINTRVFGLNLPKYLQVAFHKVKRLGTGDLDTLPDVNYETPRNFPEKKSLSEVFGSDANVKSKLRCIRLRRKAQGVLKHCARDILMERCSCGEQLGDESFPAAPSQFKYLSLMQNCINREGQTGNRWEIRKRNNCRFH